MRRRRENEPTEHVEWFRELMGILPGYKLTRAQTANLVAEGVTAVVLIPLALFKLSAAYVFVSFLAMLAFTVWCLWSTRPARRRRP